jgi:hypothetical protein
VQLTRRVWSDWDKQALADWIETQKVNEGDSYIQLENKLGLPYGTLDLWRRGWADRLSATSIQAIAIYRGWTEEQVKEWLQL